MKSKATHFLALFIASIASVHGATVTWVGLGSTDNFNDTANWSPAVALDAGNTITFDGSTRLSPNNNITLTGSDNAITFASTAGAFTLTGNAIRMGNLVNNSSNLQTINVSLRYNGSRSINTGSSGITLAQQPLSTGGARTLTKTGSGVLTLEGGGGTNISYIVNDGTLLANATVPAATVAVNNAATLGGTGTINGAVTIAATAFLAPGTSIESLAVTSATINGTLEIEYNGSGSGTIDLLAVTNALNITNATVDFSQITAPADDASYIFATYGSLVGTQFASVVNLPSGYSIDYSFGGNNIALVSIPEPAAALLGSLGLLGLIRRRR